MTIDREQARRDAEACVNDPEGSSSYFAEIVLALLAELEQAERERDANLTNDQINMVLLWYWSAEGESMVDDEDEKLARALWERLPDDEREEFRP